MVNIRWKCAAVLLCAALLQSCAALNIIANKKKDLSPYDYGLTMARTGVERYQVLYETHRAAVEAGVNVDYSGIDSIAIEIPAKAKRIPLSLYNDFRGCVFMVKNTAQDCFLFGFEEKASPIIVSKKSIDSGLFRTDEQLKRGCYLLLIEDENPWVQKRRGRDYGHQRKDILMVENGVAKNSVTMPYNNDTSLPKCSFIKVHNEPFVFKNLTIIRNSDCTKKAYVVVVSGVNDVRIQNVKLFTPENNLYGDRSLSITDCTNVILSDVFLDGTYSQPDHFGYGVSLNNIWNFKAIRMYGKADWGIFGSNDVNTVSIEDSRINRFDIHCYGRDVSFRNVEFFDLYNQYSSVYGTITYEGCSFTDFIPVLNGGSYNSYVDHEVVFNNCTFNAVPDKNYIFRFALLNEPTNNRLELAEKRLPNVTINNLTVNMKNGVNELLLFKCMSSGKKITDIGYLSNITINGLTINSDGMTPITGITLSNIETRTKSEVYLQMNDVIINQPSEKRLTKSVTYDAVLRTDNILLKDGRAKMKNVKNLVQQ